MTFLGSKDYSKDCPGVPTLISASNPAWNANSRTLNDCTGSSPPPNEAVIYVGGTSMTAKVKFSVDPVPTSPVSGVRVEGAIPGLGKLDSMTVNGPFRLTAMPAHRTVRLADLRLTEFT